jgi:hypothetical protein
MCDMVFSKLNLAYAISIVSWFMANQAQCIQSLKWILRYLNGSFRGGLKYTVTTQGKETLEDMWMWTMPKMWTLENPYRILYLHFLRGYQLKG